VYDIGVYFEANGHGTVLFSDRCKRRVHQMLDTASGRRMSALIDLINETVGDALSDLLAVEAILALSRMSIEQWDAVYEDVPSVQMKVSVRDRLAVCTTWDETRCTAPLKLQPSIDECVNACADRCARAFVRPSGTENVVRVYAEASTVDAAQRLAEGCAAAVKMCCE
jgi:phosphoacetylglucosamine mutase